MRMYSGINQCCHSCHCLFPQWWPRSDCTLCTVHCSSVHSHSSCRFQQRTSLSPSPIRQHDSFLSYFASTSICCSLLRQFHQREDFSLLFRSVRPIGYNFLSAFCSDFASKSTNNSILLERGRSYHSTLFLIFVALVSSLSSYTAVPLNCTDSEVQVYRPWAILVPAFSF